MSDTPKSGMFRLAALLQWTKNGLGYCHVLTVLAVALVVGTWTSIAYAQTPIRTVTFTDDYTVEERAAVHRAVDYWNEVIDTTNWTSMEFTGAISFNKNPNMNAGSGWGDSTLVTISGDPESNWQTGRNTQIKNGASNLESLIIHELAHSLGINYYDREIVVSDDGTVTVSSERVSPWGDCLFTPGGIKLTDLMDGTTMPIVSGWTFRGYNAMAVWGDGNLTPVPVESLDLITTPREGSTLIHPLTPFGNMNASYDSMTRPFFSEVELAIMQDLGHDINIRNFFGRSIYQTHGRIINVNDPIAPLNGTYGIGLHLVAGGNTINLGTNITTNGYAGAGIRIEDAGNSVTINPGIIVKATGEEGFGVLITHGSGATLHNYGTIEAKNGTTLNNAIYVGTNNNTINLYGGSSIVGHIASSSSSATQLNIGKEGEEGVSSIVSIVGDIDRNFNLNFQGGSLAMTGSIDNNVVLPESRGIGAGEAGDLTIRGNLTMENDSSLLVGYGGDYNKVNVERNAAIGDIIVDLKTILDGEFTILSAETLEYDKEGTKVYANGAPITEYGRKGAKTTPDVSEDNKNILLTVDVFTTGNTGNYDLIWTGAVDGSTWDKNNTENWRDEPGFSLWFEDGDAVTFDLSESHTINLADPVTVADMLVKGSGDWDFYGNITGAQRQITDIRTGSTSLSTGRLTMEGSGDLTLHGDNKFVGGTTVDAGNLRITGTIAGDITINNNTNVTFERADSTETIFGDDISGDGSLTKKGKDILALMGNNTYKGMTLIESGTLVFGGRMNDVGVITIQSGAALAGSSVNNTIIKSPHINNNGGTILVGEAGINEEGEAFLIGANKLSIDGNFTNTNGRLIVGINDALQSSLIEVTGRAIINGGILQIAAEDGKLTTSGKQHVFLTALDGLTVSDKLFATVDDPLLKAVGAYNANDYWFSIERKFLYAGEGNTKNQRAMARYIDAVGLYPNSDYREVLLALDRTYMVTTEQVEGGTTSHRIVDKNASPLAPVSDPLLPALDQLSGSIYATMTTASFQNTVMFHNALANVLRRDYNTVAAVYDQAGIRGQSSARDLKMDRANYKSTSNLWGMVYGHAGTMHEDGNVGKYRQGFSGIMAGYDRIDERKLRLGAFLSMGEGSLSSELKDRALTQEFMMGHYFRKDTGDSYILLQAGLGNHHYSTRRQILFGGPDVTMPEEPPVMVSRTARNKHNAFLATANFEVGVRKREGIFNFAPFAGVQYTGLVREGFTERGAGSVSLTTGSEDYHSLRAMFGLRFDSEAFRFKGGLTSFYGNTAWMYEFDTGTRHTRFDAQFTNAGFPTNAGKFTVYGNDPGRDWIQAGFGINHDIHAYLRAFVGYDAFANDRQVMHACNLGFVWQR